MIIELNLNITFRSDFILQERMTCAMKDYPESCAILVRRHGVYVWGESWQKAKTM